MKTVEKQLVELASQLMEIPSTKDNPADLHRVLDVMAEYCADFTVEHLESNGSPSLLIHNRPAGHKNFKIILNGHLDVVPANPSQFKPKIKNEQLWGRGSYDMKAGAAILATVFKDIASQVDYPIALNFVTDEEIGGFDGSGYLVKQGVTADFVVVGEQSELDIGTKSKGVLWVKLISNGKKGHGAYPWEGDSSTIKLVKSLNNLMRLYPTPDKEVWRTTLSIPQIHNDSEATNQIPALAEATLDIRYTPEDKNLANKTETQLKIFLASKLEPGVQAEIIVYESSQTTSLQNPYMQKLIKAITKERGEVPQNRFWHGATDLRYFTAKGMEGVIFGPRGAGMHSDKEWVDTKSMGTAHDILKSFLLNL